MSDSVRVGVVMWPIEDWPEMGRHWKRAEEYGFDTAWIYDHLAWRGHTPWDEAYSSLAAAAALTSTIRLGTLVTSGNFRTPLPTAAAIRTVDRISGGRLRLGIGAGGDSHLSDGDVQGRVWTPRERADRFAEYVEHLDALLTQSPATVTGEYFTATDVTISEGLVQQRPPFLVAGNGPRGMRLAARYGQGWIANPQTPDGEDPYEELVATLAKLDQVCVAEGRDHSSLEKVLLTGFTEEPWMSSLGAFQDLLGRYGDLGFTDVAIHWPRPDSLWDTDWTVFEEIAAYVAS
ncbi:MAG: LLM class flavin-dependent oxidoreductase [Nocardioides sp.]|uniref:LLM class flavin-dependent oxidoreductase n=1 Tax=Nocardioides sp. TaxID=35761 RepID=UPI003F0FB732